MALLAAFGVLSIVCQTTLGLNISINFKSTGKLFDGIGAISGGGVSNLYTLHFLSIEF